MPTANDSVCFHATHVREVARLHKARLHAFIGEHCEAWAEAVGADRRVAARLARQWLILIDGAIGGALVSGEADAALDARAAGQHLFDALAPQLPRSPRARGTA